MYDDEVVALWNDGAAASWTGSGEAASGVGLALGVEVLLLLEPGFAAVEADEALADVSFGLLSEGSELELLFVVTTGDFEDLEELK